MSRSSFHHLLATLSAFALAVGTLPAQTEPAKPRKPKFERATARKPMKADTPADKAEMVKSLRKKATTQRQRALDYSKRTGTKLRGDSRRGGSWEVLGIDDRGEPIVVGTTNRDAAVVARVDLLHDDSPGSLYDLSGDGVNVGIWDSGAVRIDHIGFIEDGVKRVNRRESISATDHATHVAGTIGLNGSLTFSGFSGNPNSASEGMAPEVRILSYDWSDVLSEILDRAARNEGPHSGNWDNTVASNHSWGRLQGWRWVGDANDSPSNRRGWHWYDDEEPGVVPEPDFGRYDEIASDWDTALAALPYHLGVVAAGNDRSNNPSAGFPIFYEYPGGWAAPKDGDDEERDYDPVLDPPGDGTYKNGYDSVSASSLAKNVLTVGALDKDRSMSRYSSWGPADDGRVKPEVVAVGSGVLSASDESDFGLTFMSGTSMATPGVTGTIALLQELFMREFGQRTMRGDMVKALLAHTAEDLPPAGIDAMTGFGLIDAKAAADVILRHSANPDYYVLSQDTVSDATPSQTFLYYSHGIDDLSATICWVDPAADEITGSDSTQRALINNIDIRIHTPDGQTFLPMGLDPNAPANPATPGNDVDNLKKVTVPNTQAGWHEIVIASGSEVLEGGSQDYALVVSGQNLPLGPQPLPVFNLGPSAYEGFVDLLTPGFPVFSGFRVGNPGSFPLDFSVLDLGGLGGLSGQFGQPITIPPGRTIEFPIQFDPAQWGGLPSVISANLLVQDLTNTTTQIVPLRITVPGTATDFSQQFPGAFDATNDLAGRQLLYTPLGFSRYDLCQTELTADDPKLPSDTADATTIIPSEGSNFSRQVTLTSGATFPFYGTDYSSIWVSDNGNVTFVSDLTATESFAAHLASPRVSVCFDDMNPLSGRVSHEQFHDRLAVSWEGVTELGGTGTSSFQVELFFDGRIRKTYLEIAAADAVVGISPGGGVPSDFVETNLSRNFPCNPEPIAQRFAAATSGLKAVDLANTTLTFSPRSEVNGTPVYDLCVAKGITSLPTDPTGGSTISIPANGSHQQDFNAGRQANFFGGSYGSFWINANGSLTFDAASSASAGTLGEHLGAQQISGLFTSLGAQTVNYQQLSNRVAVSWSGANNFQIELFFDGTVQLSYLSVAATDATVGLSQGFGLNSTFLATDLSECGPCSPPELSIVASNGSAAEHGFAQELSFRIYRNTPSGLPLTVSLSRSATSTSSPSDHSTLPTSVTIPAGSSNVLTTLQVIPDSLDEGNESLIIEITPSASYSVGTANTVSLTIEDKPFSSWLASIPGSSGGALGDPDGDGMNNLLEYAFGSNPTASEPGAIGPLIAIDGNDLVIDFLADRALPDLSYHAMYSADLVNWIEIDASPTGAVPEFDIAPGRRAYRAIAPTPVDATDLGFFRLEVRLSD